VRFPGIKLLAGNVESLTDFSEINKLEDKEVFALDS